MAKKEKEMKITDEQLEQIRAQQSVKARIINDVGVLEAQKHDLLNALIGGIYCDSDKAYVLSSTICDLGIKIGDVGGFDIKKRLNIIEFFFNFLAQNLECDYCEIISLEYDNQIICIN